MMRLATVHFFPCHPCCVVLDRCHFFMNLHLSLIAVSPQAVAAHLSGCLVFKRRLVQCIQRTSHVMAHTLFSLAKSASVMLSKKDALYMAADIWAF